mgnify:CR=1 FL=1
MGSTKMLAVTGAAAPMKLWNIFCCNVQIFKINGTFCSCTFAKHWISIQPLLCPSRISCPCLRPSRPRCAYPTQSLCTSKRQVSVYFNPSVFHNSLLFLWFLHSFCFLYVSHLFHISFMCFLCANIPLLITRPLLCESQLSTSGICLVEIVWLRRGSFGSVSTNFVL